MYITISFSFIAANFLTGMYIGENKNKVQGLRPLMRNSPDNTASVLSPSLTSSFIFILDCAIYQLYHQKYQGPP